VICGCLHAMDTIATLKLTSNPSASSPDSIFVETSCLPFLQRAQNADGGWGFHPGSQSRVEPTCWALHALLNASWPDKSPLTRGFQYLLGAQLKDGSWPSSPEETMGSWVTSLACWVLLSDKNSSKAVGAGINWFCEDWPRDSTPWRRFLRRLSSQRSISGQNDSLRGWGWTPRTSSWVEPTSFALLALQLSPNELLPRSAGRRQQLAEELLYDRMCPGGGWNCGNPLVYGVAGQPLVIPTAWALLALRKHADRPENQKSIEWLEKNIPTMEGPGSVALARICLESYGRIWPAKAPDLRDIYRKNEFLKNIQVTAWACLALGPRNISLTPASGLAS
jgi:squalene-hopene cyclase-like protein